MYVFSIVLIVAANVLYHMSQKSTPEKANPFVALFFTYTIAAIVSIIAYQFNKDEEGFLKSVSDLNWTSITLGFAIVGLELGYLMAYRSGWNLSIGSLVANIILAIVLIPIGVFFFKEGFEINRIFGAVLCIVGLILINK